jgi:hypothetical protein
VVVRGLTKLIVYSERDCSSIITPSSAMLGMIHVTSLSVIGSGKVILSCMSNVFVWNWTAFSFRFIAAENGRLVTLERLVSVSVKEEKEKENE